MRYVLTVKAKKFITMLLSAAMIVSLMTGLGAISSAAGENNGVISITKKELGANGQQLENRRVPAESNKSDSVCLAGDFDAGGGWFKGVTINVEQMKAAPLGIDYNIIGGDGSVYGSLNIKIINVGGVDKLIGTINNGVAGKEWGMMASSNRSGVGHSALKHDFNGTSGTINCPTPDGGGNIYLYFHGAGFGSMRYTEPNALYFEFQVQKMNASGDYVAYPINATNVIFRSEDGVVIYDGGNITNGADGKFRMKNGIVATLSNLPAGDYSIIETKNDAYITSATVNPDTDVNDSVVDIVVNDNGYVEVVFENKLISYDLTISKDVVASPTTLTIPGGIFPVRVTFSGSNLSLITNNGGFQHNSNYTVWEGEIDATTPVTFSNLSAGTTYTIDEPGLRPSYKLSTASSTSLTLGSPGLVPLDVGGSEDLRAPYSYSANLVNIYEPVAEFTLAARKTVDSGGYVSPVSWTSSFTLYKSDEAGTQGDVVQANVQATAGNPIAAFSTITLSTDGPHYFLIKETGVTGNGTWTLDSTTYYIKVDASISSNPPQVTYIGYRTAPATFEDNSWTSIATNSSINNIASALTFENTYRPAPASWTLPLRKTVSNTSQSGTFNFEIRKDSAAGDVVATCSRTGTGNFNTVFTPITFDTAGGPYTYVVMEVDPGAPWTAATPPVTIYVMVTDNGTGALTVRAYRNQNLTGEISAATDLVFNNTYTPVPLTPTRFQIGALKTVSSATSPDTWSFNFEIYESNSSGRQGVSLGTATANKTSPAITFPEIEFRATGTYYYLIRETSLGGNGWTVDNRQFLVEVTVQSQSNALRVSQVRYRVRTGSGGSFGSWATYNSSSIVFNNSYTPGPASIDLIGIKTVNSGAASKTFGITITNITDGANILVSRTYIWPGAFTLPPITYIAAGDYVYRVEEDDPGTGWVKNTSPYTIYVSVRGEAGQLTAEAYTQREGTPGDYTYDSRYLLTASDLAFDNTYTATVGGYFDLSLVKLVTKVNGNAPTRFNASGIPIVRRGDKVTFTISVRNEGSISGYAEEISDYIPSGFDFIAADNPGWDYDPDTRIATTNALYGNLLSPGTGESPGDPESVDIVLTVSSSASSGGRLKNVAEITRFGNENHDPIDDEIEENNKDDDDVVVERDVDPPDDPKIEDDDDDDDDDEGGTIVVKKDDDEDEDEDEDDGDGNRNRPPHIPGGREREVPPAPTILGNELVPLDDGGWIEFDEDGVPLGEWHWDDPLEMWVFEEYPPPLSDMPATSGEQISSPFLFLVFCTSLAVIVAVKSYTDQHKSKRNK